jgi:hypothetical protein
VNKFSFFVIIFILLFIFFFENKKNNISFIAPYLDQKTSLDFVDNYYSDMFNPFYKIKKPRKIIKLAQDGFLQSPPVRFDNALEIINNNYISNVYIGHLSNIILNSLGDFKNKNNPIDQLINNLKSKNIKISGSIDINRCNSFLHKNLEDYGSRYIYKKFNEVVLQIKDPNFKIKEVESCRNLLKELNKDIIISFDLYVQNFVSNNKGYKNIINLIKSFKANKKKPLKIYLNSFDFNQDQIKLLRCIKLSKYTCNFKKKNIKTIDIVAHPNIHSLNIKDYRPVIPPDNTKDKKLYIKNYLREMDIIKDQFKRFKKLNNNLIVFLLPIGYHTTPTKFYIEICETILGSRCIVLDKNIFKEQLISDSSEIFLEENCNDKKKIIRDKFIKKLCDKINDTFSFRKGYVRSESISYLQSKFFQKKINILQKTTINNLDKNQIDFFSYGQGYEECATTWARLFFDSKNICPIPLYNLSISSHIKTGHFSDYRLIRFSEKIFINEWSNSSKTKFKYHITVHRDLFETTKNDYFELKNFDTSCIKIVDFNGSVIPFKYLIKDSNFILPINSGLRGLDLKLAFIETCKKIDFKKDIIKVIRKKGFY